MHARRLAGDEHAEDVLQDALLRALRAYPRLRHADHLRAWLYRVTTSAAMDHHRSRRREVVTDEPPVADHPRCVRRRRLREPHRTAQRDRSHRPAAAFRRRPRLRRDRDAARLLDGRRPPARLDRRPHPPGELRMTPLPESLLESVAAAAVREGLADALFTRLNSPLGKLLVVQGPDGPRPDRLRGRARGRRPGRGRRRAGPERDRLRPRAGRRARRALGLPRGRRDDARPAGRPAADARAVPARRARGAARRSRAGETVSYGELAARAGNPGASRAVGTACARNPIPIVVPCHRVLPEHGQARQLRRRAGAQARAARARRRFPTTLRL